MTAKAVSVKTEGSKDLVHVNDITNHDAKAKDITQSYSRKTIRNNITTLPPIEDYFYNAGNSELWTTFKSKIQGMTYYFADELIKAQFVHHLGLKAEITNTVSTNLHEDLAVPRKALEALSISDFTADDQLFEMGCGRRNLIHGLKNIHYNRPVIDAPDIDRRMKFMRTRNEIVRNIDQLDTTYTLCDHEIRATDCGPCLTGNCENEDHFACEHMQDKYIVSTDVLYHGSTFLRVCQHVLQYSRESKAVFNIFEPLGDRNSYKVDTIVNGVKVGNVTCTRAEGNTLEIALAQFRFVTEGNVDHLLANALRLGALRNLQKTNAIINMKVSGNPFAYQHNTVPFNDNLWLNDIVYIGDCLIMQVHHRIHFASHQAVSVSIRTMSPQLARPDPLDAHHRRELYYKSEKISVTEETFLTVNLDKDHNLIDEKAVYKSIKQPDPEIPEIYELESSALYDNLPINRYFTATITGTEGKSITYALANINNTIGVAVVNHHKITTTTLPASTFNLTVPVAWLIELSRNFHKAAELNLTTMMSYWQVFQQSHTEVKPEMANPLMAGAAQLLRNQLQLTLQLCSTTMISEINSMKAGKSKIITTTKQEAKQALHTYSLILYFVLLVNMFWYTKISDYEENVINYTRRVLTALAGVISPETPGWLLIFELLVWLASLLCHLAPIIIQWLLLIKLGYPYYKKLQDYLNQISTQQVVYTKGVLGQLAHVMHEVFLLSPTVASIATAGKVVYVIMSIMYYTGNYPALQLGYAALTFMLMILGVVLILTFIQTKHGVNVIASATSGLFYYGFDTAKQVTSYGLSRVDDVLTQPLIPVGNAHTGGITGGYMTIGTLLTFILIYILMKFFKRTVISVIRSTIEFQYKIVNTSCVSEDNYTDVSGNLDRDTKWNLPYPIILTMEELVKMRCHLEKPGLKQICPTLIDAPPPIIYHACDATNFCAVKRQATEVAYPDPLVLADFKKWLIEVIYPELRRMLEQFDYNMEDWYEHLTAKQQKEINPFIITNNIPLDNSYEMFVKSEKQVKEWDVVNTRWKAPKNRCICSPQPAHKYVLGPVTYALEGIMAKNFKGYCGGKNWDQLGKHYNDMHDRGFLKTIQLDGAGFDRCQHYELKALIDHFVYDTVKPYIKHVDHKTWDFYAKPEWRTIKMIRRTKVGKFMMKETVGTIKQRGKTFSGSCDTTLMNTLKMAIYNRYVVEHVAKTPKNLYDLICKGDDSVVFIHSIIDESKLMEAYAKVFIDKKTGVHGLGQISKYLKIGTINDVDFCSTSTVELSYGNFAITRQLDRFLTFTPWSRKAVKMSDEDIRVYKTMLYISNLQWINDLPIFSEFNRLLYEDLTGTNIKVKTGITKLTYGQATNVVLLDYVFQQCLLEKYFDTDFMWNHRERNVRQTNAESDMFRVGKLIAEQLNKRYSYLQGSIRAYEADRFAACVDGYNCSRGINYNPITKRFWTATKIRPQSEMQDICDIPGLLHKQIPGQANQVNSSEPDGVRLTDSDQKEATSHQRGGEQAFDTLIIKRQIKKRIDRNARDSERRQDPHSTVTGKVENQRRAIQRLRPSQHRTQPTIEYVQEFICDSHRCFCQNQRYAAEDGWQKLII